MARVRQSDIIQTHQPVLSEVDQAEVPKQEETKQWPELTDTVKEEAKARANNMPIYKYSNAGQTYIFRSVAAHEWKSLVKEITELDDKDPLSVSKQNEMICNLAVVWPEINQIPSFWDRNLAGVAESLVLQIREKSGFPLTLPDGTPILDKVQVESLNDTTGTSPAEPNDEEKTKMRLASPNGKMYRAEFTDEGGVHYFRPLMRNEWAAAQVEEQRGKDSYEYVVRASLLWSSYPWATQAPLAGVVEQLFNEIMDVSGFAWDPVVEEL